MTIDGRLEDELLASALEPAAVTLAPPDDAGPPLGPRRLVALVALAVVAAVALGGVALDTGSRAEAAREAARTADVSDAWQDALQAATVQQSLGRAWRLGGEPQVLGYQDRAATTLDSALDRVAELGGPGVADAVAQARRTQAAQRAAAQAAVGSGLDVDAAASERASEDLQDQLSAAAHAAYASAALERRAPTTRPPWSMLLLATAAGATGAVLALALATAYGSTRRLRRLRRRTEDLALRDALTGLPNRSVLLDRLDQALLASARTDQCTALLVLDLDRFKEINDALGHEFGDQVLTQIAPRLRGPLRSSDTVARLGGDEFAVLLPRVQDLDAALLVAEKLQAALVDPFVVHGLPLSVEASIGVVVSPEHGRDGGTLLQRADVAMYLAKDAGLGVSAYERSLDGSSPARAAMLGQLRHAVDSGELRLAYQPKVSVATGALEGVEALVRWQHPVQGLLGPDEFLPLAERTGLVHPLTRHVLTAALEQCRRWLDDGLELPVALNLSARTLLDRGFAQEVEQMLAFWRVPAHLLELEVTETAVMADPDRARALMERLAASGVVLAIDDFGTGYSSLASLRTLPVQDLKIDRSFVTDMLTSPNDAFIVRSVVALAHDVGLRVVAEGVEDEDTLTALRELGCDVAQGFHLGRPLMGDDLAALAARAARPVSRPARAAGRPRA